MNGYDYVMASVCAVMLLLSAFGLYVYFNARIATANPKTKILKEKSTKKTK